MEPEILPQPPPGVPAPPPGYAAKRSRKWLVVIGVLGLLSILFSIVAALPLLVTRRHTHCGDETQAISNARQLGMALFEFEADYGQFPDAATIPAVTSKTATTEVLTDATSNDLFRQLVVTGIAVSEEMFYARVPGSKRPDHDITAGKILNRGECGFAFVAGLSIEGDSKRPLAVAPLVPGTLEFDPEVFHGNAIVLLLDNSVRTYPIDKNGHVIGPNGMDIFDARQSYWAGKAPDVKWPDLLPVALSPEPPKDYSGEIIVASAAGIVLITGGWFIYLLKRAAIPPELSSDAK